MSEEMTLPVTIDKSHLITIGEKLYSSSVELVRELVNNAYDADATEVRVTIDTDKVIVEDNGSGMDMKGLEQYFKIGSPEKLLRSSSPVYKRDRIGQFGIGKFATLSACKRFEVRTYKDDFAAAVVFDKDQWQELAEDWRLPLRLIEAEPEHGNGTTVILQELFKKLDIDLVQQKIMESVPLKAADFTVYLNGLRLAPRTLSGHRIPVLEGTPFGLITGEIVIVSVTGAGGGEHGVEVKVKQALIKRELFSMETWGRDMARVRGEVHADWLPITSDRTGFITDSSEYIAFMETMAKVMNEVKGSLSRLEGKKSSSRTKKAVREALERVARALTRNPDLSPFGTTPLATDDQQGHEPGAKEAEPKPKDVTVEPRESGVAPETQPATKEKRRATVNNLSPNAVVQKLKMSGSSVSCCIDSFGPDGPEVFTEGSIIYINRDHPLYQRESRKKDTHILNVARLITQEISMIKEGINPREAFDHQSILLKDAFSD